MNAQQQLHAAATYHRSGNLAEAEKLYRQILSRQPNNADALHLLGVLANQTGHSKDAVELIRKAIGIRPDAEFYFNLAGALIPLNEIDRAIEALRQAIAIKPDWGAPHANLGTLLQKTGQLDAAIAEFQIAILLEPGNPECHYNLGNALMDTARHSEAVDAFRAALKIKSDHAEALNNLGSSLHSLGQYEDAERGIRQALQIRSQFPQALNNLGNILMSLNRFEEAVSAFRQAIAIEPRMMSVYNNLGNVLCGMGHYEQAIETYRKGISLQPVWPEIHNNLSIALRSFGDPDAALAEAQLALQQKPGFFLARENIASALQQKGEMDRATELFAQLAAEQPDDDRSLNNYGNILRILGRLPEAIDTYQRAADANPADYLAASNYLFTLQFHIDDRQLLLQAHRDWNHRYAEQFKSDLKPFPNDRNPDRRLRIGYLSPDFRHHCQSLFTSALLPNHDRQQFEIFCYSAAVKPDAVSARLQSYADVWRHIPMLPDADIAKLIRGDQIDILVDLTMHMGYSRPLVLARKPAPIQVAWLAYPGTTGLWSMDYRLTDPWLDPAGFDDRYSEQSIRLPDTFWCYEPRGMEESLSADLPDPGDLPALKNGFITFGCLNDFSKFNLSTLDKWGRVMRSIDRSRLHLFAPKGKSREMVLQHLESHGIGSDRIEFIPRQSRPAYLTEYQRIDLCLDTLPYNGHTTSLDAFWMGVPVLTHVGKTVVGRAGFSQLSNLQLPDFVAETNEQFIELGIRWASDLSSLAEVRRTLRDRMSASPLMDAKKFARGMEAAFRRMWQSWTHGK